MYIKEPMKIEDKSMDIIDSVMGDVNFSDEEMLVAKRMIHTTGDFEYRKIIVFKDNFLEEAKASIEKGIKIFTDTKMAYQGINKPALEKSSCELVYYIDDDDVREAAKAKGTTRSACALEKAVENGVKGFVIGNAPTALFRLIELIKEGKVDPDFVVGVPVGFVGAAESKEALRKVEVASVSTVGTKGGSNVAASIINALLYMVYPR
mgnify:CR=1 FL=1